jgi:hypothetical protein
MDFESIEYANFSTRAGAEKGSGLRPEAEVILVLELVADSLNDCEISRRVGIPRVAAQHRYSLSVARRGSVALLDAFVGLKW